VAVGDAHRLIPDGGNSVDRKRLAQESDAARTEVLVDFGLDLLAECILAFHTPSSTPS
jgi:hypothetical protein